MTNRKPVPAPITKADIDQARQVKIDLDALTIGDLVLFDTLGGETARFTPELMDMLDRVVVGGARRRPLRDLRQIMGALQAATSAMAEPETGAGN